MNTKMKWSNALIEWESGGLEDVPTENIEEFISALETELTMRGHGYTETVLFACERIKELEKVLNKLLNSGDWFTSALEFDPKFDGNELENELKHLCKVTDDK